MWVASPWEHILKSSAPGTGKSLSLHAAANEYESGRIIVRAGAAPLDNVVVSASSLRGPGSEIGPQHIVLYREHYLHVFALTYHGNAPTGWYPDALIPFADPSTGTRPQGGKYVAAPYTIEADNNDTLLAHRAVPWSLGAIWPKPRRNGTADEDRASTRLRRLIEQKHVNALRVPFAGIDDPETAKQQLRVYADYLRRNGRHTAKRCGATPPWSRGKRPIGP